MIKHFCDQCGAEITGENEFHPRLFTFDKLPVRVEYKPNTEVGNDICKYCVIGAVQKLDDRPQESNDRG